MSIAKFIAKSGASVAGASLVAMSLVAAVPAAAQTTTTTTTTMSASQIAALEAQIASLQAQLAASQGTTASVTFTRDLTVGSTGSDVTALQTWLIAKGYSIPAGATGYFGTQTKAAVAAYQAANGISPAAGYFGPITRAKVNATGGTTTTTTTTGTTGTTTLTGGEGSINNLQVLGAPTNVTVYQGQSGQVYGFQFMASGSDLQVNRVDFDLTNNGNSVGTGSAGGNDRPWSVLQTATLYDGTTAIATVDASNANNWSEDGTQTLNGTTHQTYRIRFDNLNDVVTNGSTHQFYVAFTAQNGVSNANQTQYQVQLAQQGIRATDAMGLEQYSSAGVQNSTNFSVSNAAAGTVVISTASDNPQTGTVMASQSAATQNVVLGAFTLQAQNAPVTLYTLPVQITSTATSTNATLGNNLIEDVKLVENGQVVASQAVTTGTSGTWGTGLGTGQGTTLGGVTATNATTTLNNMNITIPAGTTQEFTIEADINSVGNTGTLTGNSPEGASAAVSLTAGDLAAADIEQGNNRVTPTGGLTGNVITFHVNGLSVDSTPTTSASATAVGTGGTQQGNFTFTFNATAFGQDIYFAKNAATALTYTVSSGGVATTTANPSAALSSTADTSTGGTDYVIHAGQTRSITVTVTIPGGSNAADTVQLNTMKYAAGTESAASSTLQFTNNYQAGPVFLHA